MDDSRNQFIYWVTEREAIRAKKEAGLPKPWSDNKVMQETYFCNADREHDKVTKALRHRYGRVGVGPDIPNWIMARMVNKPDSLFRMSWPWKEFDLEEWTRVMSQPGSWGGAYIVSTNGRAMPKHEYIAGLLEAVWLQYEQGVGASVPPTLEGWHTAIQAAQGMGSFMAAQVVADLKNTSGHPLAQAEDWSTWASHGPGSLRGLGWFHDSKITQSNFMQALVSARQWCNNNGYNNAIAHLCNQNLQNCFCEYDKYMRVSNGTGRSKRKYNGV